MDQSQFSRSKSKWRATACKHTAKVSFHLEQVILFVLYLGRVPGLCQALSWAWTLSGKVLAGTGHTMPGTVPPVKLYRPLTGQRLNPSPVLLHASSVAIEVV